MKMLISTLILTLTVVASASIATAQKITAEEMITRSLAAIGSEADRKKMFNLMAAGDVSFVEGTSEKAVPLLGRFVFASEGQQVLWAMKFDVSTYQMEQVRFNGKDLKVDYSKPGVRSIFGDYVFRYDILPKHGLLGGVLTKNWILADLASHDAKLVYDGTNKIDGNACWVFSVEPKKGSDVKIKLYFDQATSRHIRTEYRRLNSAGMGNDPNTSARLTSNREDMTEDFSDFKTDFGVTVPTTYKIHFYIERNSRTIENYYTVTLKEFFYNSKIADGTFGEAK